MYDPFRLNEGGIVAKWAEDENRKVAKIAKKSRKSPKEFRPLSMTELQAALIAYAALFTLALITLIAEIIFEAKARFCPRFEG